jgi:hypothetical protein
MRTPEQREYYRAIDAVQTVVSHLKGYFVSGELGLHFDTTQTRSVHQPLLLIPCSMQPAKQSIGTSLSVGGIGGRCERKLTGAYVCLNPSMMC